MSNLRGRLRISRLDSKKIVKICHKNFKNFQVLLKMSYKKDKTFKDVFKTPPIDWCKMMATKSDGTTFQKIFVKTVRLGAPNFAHLCPYEGVHEVFNGTVPKDVIQIFPVGHYRQHVTFADKIDKNIFTFTWFFRVFQY